MYNIIHLETIHPPTTDQAQRTEHVEATTSYRRVFLTPALGKRLEVDTAPYLVHPPYFLIS